MAEGEVARLVLWDATDPEQQRRGYQLLAHDEFDIGRQLIHEILGFEDKCVSNHHVRIHCVVYDDEDDKNRVAPMVYVRVLSSNGVVLRRNGIDDMEEGGMFVDSDMDDVLLNPGDRMQLTARVVIEFRSAKGFESNPPPLGKIRQTEVKQFEDRFQLTSRVLGCGAHAAVYVAVKHKTGQQLACKILKLPRRPLNDIRRGAKKDGPLRKEQDRIAKEYIILQTLSHPNIITLEKVFRTTYNLYIFQELITGGDLLSYIDMRGGKLPEPSAAIIVRQLLEAVKYTHDNNIVHRDIKPENILMTAWRDGARIVLTDFGQARAISDTPMAANKTAVRRMQTLVGTFGYYAPEIFDPEQSDKGYSQAIDVWSVGCVTGALIMNGIHFPDGDDLRKGNTTLSQFAAHADVIDTEPEWKRISRKARSFIKGCLTADASHRLTASECLQHQWFQYAHYKDDFDAAYERAIQGWRPKQYDEPVVEEIDTSSLISDEDLHSDDEKEKKENSSSEASETRSHYFADPKPTAPDMNSILARFRPSNLHASPVRAPDPHPPPRQQPLPPARMWRPSSFQTFVPDPTPQPASMFEPRFVPPSTFQQGPAASQWRIPDSLADLGPPQSFASFVEDDIVDLDPTQPTMPRTINPSLLQTGSAAKPPFQGSKMRNNYMHR